MATNKVYIGILETMPEGLERQVLKVLIDADNSDHRSDNTKRVSRTDMVFMVFGKLVTRQRLANSKEDRQIRRAITTLQNLGIPVFSDSASGGYWLGSEKDCAEYLKELMSRRKALDEKIASIWKTQNILAQQSSQDIIGNLVQRALL